MRLCLNSLVNERKEFLGREFQKKIKNKKLVCYGASTNFREIDTMPYIKDLVEFFVDGNSDRWGEIYYGKEIKNPEEIRNLDKSEYAVVVLTVAFHEVSKVLDNMGLKKGEDYFSLLELCKVRTTLESYVNAANKVLDFLDTLPKGLGDVIPSKEKKYIGIIVSAEGLDHDPEFPYSIALFLILKWKGYHVKLIVDNLYWTSDIVIYRGKCEDCTKILDKIMCKLEKIVPQDDIMYIDSYGRNKISKADEKECERIAEYSAKWQKWVNQQNPRYMSEDLVRELFAEVFKRNICYVDAFFEHNQFDSVNNSTALHKRTGVITYVCNKRGIRVSSQDGINGIMLLSADGPAGHGSDISRVVKERWLTVEKEKEVLLCAMKMSEKRFSQNVLKNGIVSHEQYEEAVKLEGYANVCFQSTRKKTEQKFDVVIPLNAPYDGAALGINTIFGSMKQWLLETLDFVINKLKRTVLLREHPAMKIQPDVFLTTNLANIAPDILVRYKDNGLLWYADFDENINLYQYIEQCKAVIPWVSTVGVEAAVMRKNVIVHTDAYYGNGAFVMKAHSRDEYFSFIRKCLSSDEWLVQNEKMAYQEALKYFYFGMRRRLRTSFTSFDRDARCITHEWLGMSFEELLKAEGVDQTVQIVAENIPSVYLTEQQY